jgi:hypothetical protein
VYAKTLIVLAHPESASFSGALKDYGSPQRAESDAIALGLSPWMRGRLADRTAPASTRASKAPD